jgi:hypothetical protein
VAIAKRLSVFVGTLLLTLNASAHPMPNTRIEVSADARGTRLIIAVPVPELRLALPADFPRDADLAAKQTSQALRSYFNAHLAVLSDAGVKQGHVIESMTVSESTDPDIGRYQELALRVWTPAAVNFDPQSFTLEYDAIIHQVPNHSAIVQLERTSDAQNASLITYDFSRNGTRPLRIRLNGNQPSPGSRLFWAFTGVVVLGLFIARRF